MWYYNTKNICECFDTHKMKLCINNYIVWGYNIDKCRLQIRKDNSHMSEIESHSQVHYNLYISEAKNQLPINFDFHPGKSNIIVTASTNFVHFTIDLS